MSKLQAGNSNQGKRAAGDLEAVPIPSPDDILRDYRHMVDFGPRFPGHPNHLRFVDFLVSDFEASGLLIAPRDDYKYECWVPITHSLDVETDSGTQHVQKVGYFVRSKPTPPNGVKGPLFFGGEIVTDGPVDIATFPEGSIVVLIGKLLEMTPNDFTQIEYLHGYEGDKSEFLDQPYKRLWLTPVFNLDEIYRMGAAGVVIIMEDVASDMIANNYTCHNNGYRAPVPVLFVGNDEGQGLIDQARRGQQARLVLEAEWLDTKVPSVTAVLPGKSDETIIIDTHTDGLNAIQENGSIALIQLARHFASLPADQKLERTLVFACWAGHMSGGLPECSGWIESHKDIVGKAVAALTIEHLGASEWEDSPETGYGATGRNELMVVAATRGLMSDLAKEGIQRFNLGHHGLEPGPGFTTGAQFHDIGVPHLGFLGGPNYLLGVTENGHIDKVDADLASRQMHMLAELVKKLDSIPKATLKAGDESCGAFPDRNIAAIRHKTFFDKAKHDPNKLRTRY